MSITKAVLLLFALLCHTELLSYTVSWSLAAQNALNFHTCDRFFLLYMRSSRASSFLISQSPLSGSCCHCTPEIWTADALLCGPSSRQKVYVFDASLKAACLNVNIHLVYFWWKNTYPWYQLAHLLSGFSALLHSCPLGRKMETDKKCNPEFCS